MDNDETAIIYGLEYQARSLAGLYGDDESIRFLVGTQSLRGDNQIHLIAYDEETRQISKYLFAHNEGEVWGLTSTPCDPQMFISTYSSLSESRSDLKMRARVWRLPDQLEDQTDAVEDNSQVLPLEFVCSLPTEDYGDVKVVVSHPGEGESDLVCLVDSSLLLCQNPNGTGYQTVSVGTLEGRGQPRLTAGRWNPHHGSTQVATASDTTIKGWDLRTMKPCFTIESAHSQLVRDLDYNPNRQYFLASCGDDCRIRLWDVRQPRDPLHQLQAHSHWVWTVRYNPFHDQLLISGSSDSRVCLHGCSAFSSEPTSTASTGAMLNEGGESGEEEGSCGEDDGRRDLRHSDISTEDNNKQRATDGLIRVYEEHEDSVYAAEWSLVDPWVFASLSYDGRLVINQVPKREKFKILL